MNKEIELSISLVIYKNNPGILRKLFDSLSSSKLKTKVFIIDNSPSDNIKNMCNRNLVYIFNNKNIGFAKAHNIAISQIITLSKYHLVINPDIIFKTETLLEDIYNFMEHNQEIGLLMPKILYPEGSIQYLCRLLPIPYDLMLRKIFVPFFSNRQNIRYELRFADYNKILDVPFLSGCFMFIRTEALRKVGIFDERFFMYFEDLDLSRRIHKYYRTVYHPVSAVIHSFEKSPTGNFKLLEYHISSSIKYFNKWGWFFDKERTQINQETLQKIAVDI